MSSRSRPVISFLPVFLTVAAFVLVLLVLLSGVNNSLVDLFSFKTNVSGLKIPSALSGSEELKGLGAVTGTDFVGEDITASSLGLANEYTISLLTFCARFPSGPSCSAPRVGFWFNPGNQLRLDLTSLQSTYPAEYRDALAAYNKTAYFVAFCFVFCALLIGLCALLSILGAVLPSVSLLSTGATALAILATFLLLAGNAAAVHIFRRLNNAFNSAFNEQGLSSSLGLAPILMGWFAFVLILATAVILVLRSRGDATTRGRRRPSAKAMLARSVADDPMGAGIGGGKAGLSFDQRQQQRGGILGRIPTWGRHKYVQVERQPALGLSDYPQAQTGVIGGGAMPQQQYQQQPLRSADEDWSAEHDYARPRSAERGPVETRAPGGAAPRRNVNMAYEPYSSAM